MVKLNVKYSTLKEESIPHIETYVKVSAFLGCIGAINTSILGIYLVTTCFSLTIVPKWASLIRQIYITAIVNTFCVFLLLYGSYLLWRKHTYLGGVMNLSVGIITMIVYAYFSSVFPLLDWLNPAGYMLLVPSPMSGLLAILILKDKK